MQYLPVKLEIRILSVKGIEYSIMLIINQI